ncbi:DUF4240 domain-containing protein [Streptomyces chrestomyceticus]|uniref:DUF4240 domain-containing protein n=1 Tax=Streptomyces chrestomyceticus TaxID=68185 RepID=UPI0019D066D6
MWAAAYLNGGGCSDDRFSDFIAGPVALGCEWYERAAICPGSLAQHPAVRKAAATGTRTSFSMRTSTSCRGPPFDFDGADQMRRRLPRLAALHLSPETA